MNWLQNHFLPQEWHAKLFPRFDSEIERHFEEEIQEARNAQRSRQQLYSLTVCMLVLLATAKYLSNVAGLDNAVNWPVACILCSMMLVTGVHAALCWSATPGQSCVQKRYNIFVWVWTAIMVVMAKSGLATATSCGPLRDTACFVAFALPIILCKVYPLPFHWAWPLAFAHMSSALLLICNDQQDSICGRRASSSDCTGTFWDYVDVAYRRTGAVIGTVIGAVTPKSWNKKVEAAREAFWACTRVFILGAYMLWNTLVMRLVHLEFKQRIAFLKANYPKLIPSEGPLSEEAIKKSLTNISWFATYYACYVWGGWAKWP